MSLPIHKPPRPVPLLRRGQLARRSARTSILESIKERLRKAPPHAHQDSDPDSKELDRLMRLAIKMAAAGSGSDRTRR
jgi:hypothetical protein